MTIPSHIGQYRIVRKLGAGGMGTVFLGEHMLLGRRAAIKTLLPTVAANREIVERFFNEARAASTISDPGVIQIFDFGYHVDGTAYIVMELLEGEALSARIDRLGKLPLAEALRIARQIAASLAAAHARDVVHRDLKPDNIFLVRDLEAQNGERTKILDFGICKVGALDGDVAVTQAGAMVGTPVYMSPEQCRGVAVDHRSDIYAFGCLLFHMLTGRPPFIGEASGDLIVAHMQADPPAPSLYVGGLPFEIDALVLRCLAKAPDDRFPSMSELHLVLGDIYAQLDTTESTVAAVTPAMQLGQGFRSVYDANLSRFVAGGSRISPATHRLRPPLRSVATPPATPPRLRWMKSAPDLSGDDDDLVALLQPRRTAVRAVLAALIVAGVIGVAVMPMLRDGDDRSAEAGTAPLAGAPSERIPELEASSPPEAAALAAGLPDPAPLGEATSQLERTVERTSGLLEPAPSPPWEPEAPPAVSTGELAAAQTRSAAETGPPPAPSSSNETEVAEATSGTEPPAPSQPPTETPPRADLHPATEPRLAAQDKPPAETKPPAEARSPETRSPETESPAQTKSKAVTETRSAPATRPSMAISSLKRGPIVSPAQVVATSKSASSTKSTQTRSAAETRSTVDDKPLAPPSPPPAQPSPPPPPRPPPSNEDLYDTR